MSTIGSPVFFPPQLKSPIAVEPGQQATVNTQSTSVQRYPADSVVAQKPDDANSLGEHSHEGGERFKRHFNFFRPKPKPPRLPSTGLPGKYKPTVNPVSGSSGGAPNTAGITNFRNLVFNAQYPHSSFSGPTKAVVARPQTFGDVAKNLVVADRLVKAGVFKTDTPLKTVARDAFVNASVNGLVSTPLSVGTYAGSVWTGETIKGNFSANTPVLPAAHLPALNQQANGAAATGGVEAQHAATVTMRLDKAELTFLLAANTILTMVEGGDANGLAKHSNWPTGTKERLDNLEKLYGAAEKNLATFAEQNEFIFKAYVPDSASAHSDAERLSAIEKRNAKINEGIARMLAIRSLETEGKEQVV
ncbi:hypothetical protein [Pseudomonas sp. MUP55]|uniref:hypothetical protein n=1 Tax=Pseudomonas sp. MUP55 TaxID=3087234 RepID=UPI002A5A92DD|nr:MULTISPECIES: hypothetical protein [unclassified Pseudomonas]WPN92134.1 hypothetical protein SC319_23385 [Pseudomonas sp. MUP56]WPN97659.1 hypothetical protein SC318_23380 [Pseudomonas sp. MUP55]